MRSTYATTRGKSSHSLFHIPLKASRNSGLLPKRCMSAWGLSVLLSCLSVSCVSLTTTEKYGIQADALAYIPARIAVIECIRWPNKIAYENQKLTNASQAITEKLCQKLDQSIIKAFEGQPYMRGLSPKIVKTLLARTESMTLLDEIDMIWVPSDPSVIKTCKEPIGCYKKAIANQEDWRLWLDKFSKKVANSDAILMPMLTYAWSGRTDERGLAKAFRQAGLVLLLIDTNSGQLIWAGGRQAEAQQQKSLQDTTLADLPLPSWEELEERLFVSDIFAEFPGRQNY